MLNSYTYKKVLKTEGRGCVEGEDASSISCDVDAPEDKYRRLDGLCNNLENKQWGAAGIAMRRLAPRDYADDISSPRGRGDLPSPRKVSESVHAVAQGTGPLSSKGFSHMAMQWGHFLGHDITLTPQSGPQGVS